MHNVSEQLENVEKDAISKNYQDILEQLERAEKDANSSWVKVKKAKRKGPENSYGINLTLMILLKSYAYKNNAERPTAIKAFEEASKDIQTQYRLHIPRFLLSHGIPDEEYLNILFKDYKVKKGWTPKKGLLEGLAVSRFFNKLAYMKHYGNYNLLLERLLSSFKPSFLKNATSPDDKWNKLVDFVTDLEKNNSSTELQKVVGATNRVAMPSFILFALKEIGLPKELTNHILSPHL